MRMFAGPNGSGKSTLKKKLLPELRGHYINPDEIEEALQIPGYVDLGLYGVTTTTVALMEFFRNSILLKKAGLSDVVEHLRFADGRLGFTASRVNGYIASVTADFIRQKLLEQEATFTFETVMSSPDKVELLKQAQRLGYRTYLYYIATEDPAINISRVHSRVVVQGGHSVPEDKITSRYIRSLDLLMEAIRYTNRAYVFDNSAHLQAHTWLAEITDGCVLEMKAEQMPAWFKRAVLDKTTSFTG
jgi:predicted ABC-type ATPase